MIVLDDRKEVLERLWNHVDYVGTSAANPYALEQQIAGLVNDKIITPFQDSNTTI